jgi:hypothetical protein
MDTSHFAGYPAQIKYHIIIIIIIIIKGLLNI